MSAISPAHAITTEHLRLNIGPGPNNQARTSLAYVHSFHIKDDGDVYLLDFGNKQSSASGILAYEKGEGKITFSCNCRKNSSCAHGLTALWHRALAKEKITADQWWEGEKKRREEIEGTPQQKEEKRLARAQQREQERQARAQQREKLLEEQRIYAEQAQQRIEQAAAQRLEEAKQRAERERQRTEDLRAAQERDRIRQVLVGPPSTTNVSFLFDPQKHTIEPLVEGRRFNRVNPEYARYYNASAYYENQLKRQNPHGFAYEKETHVQVQVLKTLIDTLPAEHGNVHKMDGGIARQILLIGVDAGLITLPDGKPLTKGATHKVTPVWEIDDQGGQEIRLTVEGQSRDATLIDVDGYMLIGDGNVLHEIDTGLSKGVFERICDLGTLYPDEACKVNAALSEDLPEHCLPRPLNIERRKATPRPVITLDQRKRDGKIIQEVAVAFEYDWGQVSPQAPNIENKRLEGNTLVVEQRNLEEERKFMTALSGAGEVKRREREKDLILSFDTNEHNSVPFKRDILPQLEANDDWNVTRSQRWNSDLITWEQGDSFGLDLSDPADEFLTVSISADVEGIKSDVMPALIEIATQIPPEADDEEVNRILDQIIDPRGCPLRREGGGVLLVPADVVREVTRSLWRFIHDAQIVNGMLRVSKLSLSDLVDLGSDVRLRSGTMISRLVEMLRGQADAPHTPVPNTFNSKKHKLDTVQQQGLDWMQALLRAGFGGVLADEVGVGKTLQLLLQPASMLDQGLLNDQALIVVPKSAIQNWAAETAEFFPGLKFLVWEGPGRHRNEDKIKDVDLVITTFSSLNLDEALNNRRWSYVGIDEAQDVKTPTNDWTQTILALEADQKIPATGTPLENSLIDIWTLMQIANDGLLGPLGNFRRNVQTPIEKHGDNEVQRRLARFLQPFMLHRTRKQAGHNIPDPIFIDRPITVSGSQARLYEMERLAVKSEISAILQEKGFKRGKGQILSALTRLRQICCHPRLVKKDYAQEMAKDGSSAKTEDAVSTALRLKSEGKKILVFSQWVGHLDLLTDAFAQAGITSDRIDGSMSTARRKKSEDEFKSGKADVLFITMGTGGKSLNIPQADAVFIMDPWWNPQKEIQGVGRTQRRGQTKVIEVYRFIVENSIEIRIVEIQKRKLKLADSLFDFRTPEQQMVFDENDLWNMLRPLNEQQPMQIAA